MEGLNLPSKASEKLTQIMAPLAKEMNLIYRESKESYPQLDPNEAGSWFLAFGFFWLKTTEGLGREPENQSLAILELWEITLTLQGKSLTDEGRYSGLGTSILDILKLGPVSFVGSPKAFLSALVNLLIKLPSRPQRESFTKLNTLGNIPTLTMDDLLKFWLVAAWKSGLSPWREAALGALETLPSIQQNHLLENLPLETWKRDPWTGYKGNGITAVGDFVGFGGFFSQPPLVVQIGNEMVIHCNGKFFELVADAFSLTLIPRKDFWGQSFEKCTAITPKSGLEKCTNHGIFPATFTSGHLTPQVYIFTTSLHHKVFAMPLGGQS